MECTSRTLPAATNRALTTPTTPTTNRPNRRYNTYAFDGRKRVVLGTTTWLGTRNIVLGVAFLATGGMSALAALVYGAAAAAYRPPGALAQLRALGYVQ